MTKSQERIPITLTIAIVLTVVIVLGQDFGYPSDIKDIVTGQFNKGIRLHYPITYLLFAPFFQIADHLSILSTRQHIAFGSAVNLFWIGFRSLKLFGTPFSIRLFLIEVGKVLLLNLGFFWYSWLRFLFLVPWLDSHWMIRICWPLTSILTPMPPMMGEGLFRH